MQSGGLTAAPPRPTSEVNTLQTKWIEMQTPCADSRFPGGLLPIPSTLPASHCNTSGFGCTWAHLSHWQKHSCCCSSWWMRNMMLFFFKHGALLALVMTKHSQAIEKAALKVTSTSLVLILLSYSHALVRFLFAQWHHLLLIQPFTFLCRNFEFF